MTTQRKFRRGTTAQHSSFTGVEAEVTFDTDLTTLVAHDGATAGGIPLVNLSVAQTLTNKTLTAPVLTSAVLNTGVSGTAVLDEDNMASDSATQLATQQSIKAYVDASGGVTTLAALTDTDVTGITAGDILVGNAGATDWADVQISGDATMAATGALTLADHNDTRTNLGLAIGSDVQAFGAVLDDFNTLGAAASDGEFIVATGAGAFAYESGATARTSMGVGTGDSPQLTGIELGHASDTTLTRSAAGVLAVEGVVVGLTGQHTIWVPAAAMEAAVTTAPATSNAVEIGTSLFAARTMDFATDADDFAYFGIQMPKSWDAGTLICQFVWSATGTTANTVLWAIAATSLGDDEVLTTAFPAPASPAADTNSTTADDIMISAEVTLTVGDTPTAENYVIFEVSRDVSGDTLAEDARLHGIRIHYTTDTGNDT